MIKKISPILLTVFSIFLGNINAEELSTVETMEDISYDWLINGGSHTNYTDHLPAFKEIFRHIKVKTFLEFGLGLSTKYFLDNSRKVISVEFITPGTGPEWYLWYSHFYKNATNWIPIAYLSQYPTTAEWAIFKYFGSEHVYKAASHQCSTHQSYADIDNFYLKELQAFMHNLKKCHKIEIAFVDAGIYLRGDLVQLLFDISPIVVAHDTIARTMNIQNDVYGYSRVTTPDNYEEIFIPTTQGTTVWLLKHSRFDALSQALKQLSQTIGKL